MSLISRSRADALEGLPSLAQTSRTALPERDLFWRLNGQRALRRGNLKYVQLADGVDHLYDVVNDLHEQADLAKKQPDDLADLRASWEAINATQLQYPA